MDNLNKDNEWLKFLETGETKEPAIKKKPRPAKWLISRGQQMAIKGDK